MMPNMMFGSQRSYLMGCPYKNCQIFSKSDVFLIFKWALLASFVFRNNFSTKPLATDYLSFSIVLPWATFGYLLSYA